MTLSVGEQARWWGVGLAVLIALVWALGDALLPYLAGAALAYFLDPVADRLEAAGLSRASATAVITLVMAGIFVLALLFLIPALAKQFRDLAEQLPVYADAARKFVEHRYPEQFQQGSTLDTALSTLRENAKSWSGKVLQSAWSGGLAIIDFVTLLVITPVVAFYLLLDWDRMVAKIDGWIPRDHVETVRSIARDIDAALAGFVRGQLTVCLILGTFYAVGLMAVGLQFGLVIGMFAGLISFIPFVGSITGLVLSVGVALFQFWGDPMWIAAVAAVFLIGQAIEGNVLTPYLVGGSVGLHPVALMFALSAFGVFLGFTGLLIAVPTAACIGVLARFAIGEYKSGRLYQGGEWEQEQERIARAGADAAVAARATQRMQEEVERADRPEDREA